MDAAKCQINGSDYIGAFATSTEHYTFVPYGIPEKIRAIISKVLKTECVCIPVSGTDLIGLFSRANSNGIALSNMVSDDDIRKIREMDLGINVGVIDSSINAVGNTILVNDRIAIVDPEYTDIEVKQIQDVLGVEVLKEEIGGFKTVGATNILTNSGCAINNHSTDIEKKEFDSITGFDSVRTTADRGSLSIGLASIANSKGLLVGEDTTGFEMNRIIDGLSALS